MTGKTGKGTEKGGMAVWGGGEINGKNGAREGNNCQTVFASK